MIKIIGPRAGAANRGPMPEALLVNGHTGLTCAWDDSGHLGRMTDLSIAIEDSVWTGINYIIIF